jgi:hypothetical protein
MPHRKVLQKVVKYHIRMKKQAPFFKATRAQHASVQKEVRHYQQKIKR